MMANHQIKVNTKLCVGCGLCKWDCPVNNIDIVDRKANVKNQDCMKCGHCSAVCPKAAISMTGFHSAPIEVREQAIVDPQQLLWMIQTGRSVRHFKKRALPDETIQKIIEAGQFTPTAKNAQNVSYIVLKDEIRTFETKALAFLKKILPFARYFVKGGKEVVIDNDFFFKDAPAAILVVSSGGFGKVNGSLAAANMALMAEASGLGLLYSGFFTIAANHSRALRKSLGLKSKEKVVMTLVLGYPDVTYYRTVQRENAAVQYK